MINRLECHQLTSVGDRSVNQDFMLHQINSNYSLFVVADGLGGHYGGDKASEFFCQCVFRQAPRYQKMLQDSKHSVKAVFEAWMAAAVDDMKILFAGDEQAEDAYTTCVVLYLDHNISVTAHCGDSRIYRLNHKQVLWRTKDHSLIQQQVDKGDMTESEMANHPEQNQLSRSINIQKRHAIEINIYPAIHKGETFVLCTDGFWSFIKHADLLQLASAQCNKDKVKKITKMAHLRANGKGDNITVQWVRCI